METVSDDDPCIIFVADVTAAKDSNQFLDTQNVLLNVVKYAAPTKSNFGVMSSVILILLNFLNVREIVLIGSTDDNSYLPLDENRSESAVISKIESLPNFDTSDRDLNKAVLKAQTQFALNFRTCTEKIMITVTVYSFGPNASL